MSSRPTGGTIQTRGRLTVGYLLSLYDLFRANQNRSGGEPSQKGRKATQNGKGKGKRAFEEDSEDAGPSTTRKVINHVTLGKSESAKALAAKFDKFSTDLDALGVLAGDIAGLLKVIEDEEE